MNAVVHAAEPSWSPYQEAIFEFVTAQKGNIFAPVKGENLMVRATAGSGKSTTLIELVRRLTGNSTILLAFNKTIAEALKAKGVNARTFHSLCYNPVLRFKNARQVEPNKLRMLVDEHLSEEDARMYGSFITKLVGLARQQGIGCLVDDTEENWMEIVDHHDLELQSERAEMTRAIKLARGLLVASNADARVDFDDLLYIAVKEGIALPKFDVILGDEWQDTNAIQRAIVRKLMHDSSRLVAVGDPAQAIYGFRGADADSMEISRQEFDCKELPLTVSYRCPVKVVEYAKQFGVIESAPGAKEGAVTDLGAKWDAKVFQANDLVLCRVTRPLIGLAYQLLKARVPAYIMGKEIGAGLVSLIKKLNAKGIDNLVERLNIFTTREVEKAIAKKQESKAAAIQDKTDCILFLIDSRKETDRTVPELIRVIDQLFADKDNAVVLSTIHKAKGLEANRVFWIDRGYKCYQAKQDWQKQEERNLCFVAATRAKSELFRLDISTPEAA